MTEATLAPKKHRFLVAAEIVFCPLADTDQINTVRMNTIISNPVTTPTVTTLDKAQRSCQMQFFRQFDSEALPTVEVLDVVLLQLSYLGETTDDEFYDKKEQANG